MSEKIKPAHYNSGENDVISFCFKNNIKFCEGNVIKYIVRHQKKNGSEDIKKAIEYCNRILKDVYNEK